jgi:hypothetical protein
VTGQRVGRQTFAHARTPRLTQIAILAAYGA